MNTQNIVYLMIHFGKRESVLALTNMVGESFNKVQIMINLGRRFMCRANCSRLLAWSRKGIQDDFYGLLVTFKFTMFMRGNNS